MSSSSAGSCTDLVVQQAGCPAVERPCSTASQPLPLDATKTLATLRMGGPPLLALTVTSDRSDCTSCKEGPSVNDAQCLTGPHNTVQQDAGGGVSNVMPNCKTYVPRP